MQDRIMKYVRDGRGRRVGMLVGKKITPAGKALIGWSRCRRGDVFDREAGMGQALDHLGNPVPPSFEKAAKVFRVQCFLFFKGSLIQDVIVRQYARLPRKVRNGVVHNSGHRDGCQYDGNGTECICRSLALSSVCAPVAGECRP